MKTAAAFVVITVLTLSMPIQAEEDLTQFLADARTPAEYVLSVLSRCPVVIFGEAHWVREEVSLVRDLVPLLPDSGTRTIAVEVFPAEMQATLDAVLSAEAWNEALAMEVLREAAMPHEEYLEIIEAVWKTRRAKGNDSLHLVALGPGSNFRETLPPGVTYDSFMADKVKEALSARKGRIFVYTGLHHAFTRYLQPETTLDGRARAFMVRMGNLLRWELGERVFVIASHRPVSCGAGDDWAYCEPFGGVIDCAASKVGRGPFGFDVAGSPFAELRFGPRDLYTPGYPDLRLVDFVDGLVWFGPPDALRETRIIPLDRYAPSEVALAEVSEANPFDDRKGLTKAELDALWLERIERGSQPILTTRWKGVGDWRANCALLQP